MFAQYGLVDSISVVGECGTATIWVVAWFALRVGHDHRVAVRVLFQNLGGPVKFLLGDIKT